MGFLVRVMIKKVMLLPKEDKYDTLEISPITVFQRMEDQSNEHTPLHKRVINIDTTSKSMMNSTAILRRFQREKKNAILHDYLVYLQKRCDDLGIVDDPKTFYNP